MGRRHLIVIVAAAVVGCSQPTVVRNGKIVKLDALIGLDQPEITRRMGEPDQITGTGVSIWFFELDDRGLLVVAWHPTQPPPMAYILHWSPDGRRLLYERFFSPSGETFPLHFECVE